MRQIGPFRQLYAQPNKNLLRSKKKKTSFFIKSFMIKLKDRACNFRSFQFFDGKCQKMENLKGKKKRDRNAISLQTKIIIVNYTKSQTHADIIQC